MVTEAVGSLADMEQRVSLITLGVHDLDRARRFYELGLGWAPAETPDGVVFYQLPGIALALFGREDLAEDARCPIDGRFSGITIAINQRTEAEVDAVLKQAESAGATILKPAEKVFWGGYSGYFSDPDGHVWEVALNPGWTINDDGTLTI
ncbi:glyoxalase [Mycolicibacterium cyprinidarum]|uniref:Glyoxalase n=1 Tax=Mycolicibacterium cyprinidarum TaxID=2860311 RepID=A0ABQ4V581_9MYCO|nr:glyoxalase [Mycolicibacterium sp. NGTWSNA01]GJF14752.1 glyoxalase [Mycolicibacterium sp. NGTWS0302]